MKSYNRGPVEQLRAQVEREKEEDMEDEIYEEPEEEKEIGMPKVKTAMDVLF